MGLLGANVNYLSNCFYLEFINTKYFLDMIGFAIYCYEGVGIVLPVLDITANPKQYPTILMAVMTTVLVVYLSFGEFCYFVYGDDLQSNPIILNNLPIDTTFNKVFISILRILFSINLFFTYPLVIFPANMIIESYIFKNMVKSRKRQWLKNLYRTGMVAFTVVLALSLGNSLNEFLSLLGSLACTPIAFTLPALFHYKLCAKSKRDKAIDIVIIVVSVFIFFFCSAFNLYSWISNAKDEKIEM